MISRMIISCAPRLKKANSGVSSRLMSRLVGCVLGEGGLRYAGATGHLNYISQVRPRTSRTRPPADRAAGDAGAAGSGSLARSLRVQGQIVRQAAGLLAELRDALAQRAGHVAEALAAEQHQPDDQDEKDLTH